RGTARRRGSRGRCGGRRRGRRPGWWCHGARRAGARRDRPTACRCGAPSRWRARRRAGTPGSDGGRAGPSSRAGTCPGWCPTGCARVVEVREEGEDDLVRALVAVAQEEEREEAALPALVVAPVVEGAVDAARLAGGAVPDGEGEEDRGLGLRAEVAEAQEQGR